MDEKEFKTRAERLSEVAKVLEKLPAEVRREAFDLLKGYVDKHSSASPGREARDKPAVDDAGDSEEAFFAAFDHDKPHDNAKLIAAWLYREYGTEPFSVGELREKADAVGITIPGRVDNTIRNAAVKGKSLFQSAGRGRFKPTVHGEKELKKTYSVKKGTKKRPKEGE